MITFGAGFFLIGGIFGLILAFFAFPSPLLFIAMLFVSSMWIWMATDVERRHNKELRDRINQSEGKTK